MSENQNFIFYSCAQFKSSPIRQITVIVRRSCFCVTGDLGMTVRTIGLTLALCQLEVESLRGHAISL